MGKQKLVIAQINLQSHNTLEEEEISFAMVHFGHHHVFGGVSTYHGPEKFSRMQQEIKEAFVKGQISEVIQALEPFSLLAALLFRMMTWSGKGNV